MRIWHEKLIPKLCQKHLCAMWREGLGCFEIITKGKTGYSHHPAVLEWKYAPKKLYAMLLLIRTEMLLRGYHPKELPRYVFLSARREHRKEWESFEVQVEKLKGKNCKCKNNL